MELFDPFIGHRQMTTVSLNRGVTPATLLLAFLIAPALRDSWYLWEHCFCCPVAVVSRAVSHQRLAFTYCWDTVREAWAQHLNVAVTFSEPCYHFQCVAFFHASDSTNWPCSYTVSPAVRIFFFFLAWQLLAWLLCISMWRRCARCLKMHDYQE